ncbi:MAG: hypothetical protein EA377_09940 [Phycisphaerales bacterium]|nr:MAG: hypothetical protein EA377_09940 [Phycisphaerales bacterium]
MIRVRSVVRVHSGPFQISPGQSVTYAYSLNAEEFDGVRDAKAHAARWKNDYNHRRPHSSLGYVPPAVFAATCSGGCVGTSLLARPQLICSKNCITSLLSVKGHGVVILLLRTEDRNTCVSE